MSNDPIISIGVPVYNGISTIENALYSLLDQGLSSYEIIISDNASTDETEKLCKRIVEGNQRLRYYRQNRNIGASGNFNFVKKLARGKYFMWLAADDWIDHEYIKKCIDQLERNPELGLVGGRCKYYISNQYYKDGESFNLLQDDPAIRVKNYFSHVVDNHVFYGVYRRSCVEDLELKDAFAADWEFVAQVAARKKVSCLDSAIIYRQYNFKSTQEYVRSVTTNNFTERLFPYSSFSFRIFKLFDSSILLYILAKRFIKYEIFHSISIFPGYIPQIWSIVSNGFKKIYLLLIFPFIIDNFVKKTRNNKYKIALFSPFPPARSGIADYSVDMINSLSGEYEFNIFVDIDYPLSEISNSYFIIIYSLYYRIIKKKINYKHILYQIGSSHYHKYIYPFIEKYSGIVVLHDGLRFKYSGDKIRLLKGCRLVVHSNYARDELLESGFDSCDVHKIRLIMPVMDTLDGLERNKSEIRKQMMIDSDIFVIGCFGIVSPAKNIPAVIDAVNNYFSDSGNFLLILAGSEIFDAKVIHFLDNHTNDTRYRFCKNLSLDEFYKLIITTDLCFNVRYPFYGETSSSLLRIMSCAVPAVVTDIGSFSEIPDDCVIKTSTSIDYYEYLNIIDKGFNNRSWLRGIGKNAYEYILNKHSPARFASDLLSVLNHSQ